MQERIEGFYDESTQREWERLEQHRTEFAVTVRALHDFLTPPPARVLDVGGGPGRYAIALAHRGYQVTLVDLSRRNLQAAAEHARVAGAQVENFVHADATDLSFAASSSFDAVLLLGPLYHLLEVEERRAALREAHRVLAPGGTIFAAFITRYAPVRYAAKHDPALIVTRRAELDEFLESGRLRPGPNGGFGDAYLAHSAEIRPLLADAGFDCLTVVACEGVVSMIEERVNELEGELWDAWVELNYRLGADPSVHGGAEHLLYVGRKPQP
ncbi:MAG TPA: class I SAM-dependent methyltransferase [Ardenticatenaceae bacterium]|nr:class I SAM-dependent methyltransferase [Ardenticatenaceae bacterium]